MPFLYHKAAAYEFAKHQLFDSEDIVSDTAIFAIASLALTEVKNNKVLMVAFCMLMACAGSGWGFGCFFEAPARSSQADSQEERLQLDEVESSATDAADVSGPSRIMYNADRLTNTLTGLVIAYA